MVINSLKVFDIVFVMGNAEANKTEVIAERMIRWFFISNNDGRGAAIAVVLFVGRRAGDGVERQAVPRAGEDPVSLAAPPAPSEVSDGLESPRKPAKKEAPVGVKKGGWFVRITIIVVVVIWLIPTVGVLVTSFRPERLVDTTGWWTALGHPWRAGEWTLDNYRSVLDAGGFSNALLNSLAVTIPATVMPITIAAFAAYAFSWMEFRGRYVLFVVDRRSARRAVADRADPDPAAVHTRLGRRGRARSSPTCNLNGTFLGIWLAHTAFGLPLAVYLLRNYIGSLPSSIVESAKHRRRRPLHDLLAADRAAVGARARGVRDLPVPVGLERPAGRVRVPRRHAGHPGGDDRAWPTWSVRAARTGICSRRPRSSRCCSRSSVFFSLQRYFVRGLTAGSVKG